MRQNPIPSCTRSEGRGRLRDGLVIAALIISSGLIAMTGLPGRSDTPSQELAAVFPPWTSSSEAAARSLAAGMRVLRSGALPFVMIVAASEQEAVRPDGALLLLRLEGLAGCLSGGGAA
jgi:hypothetical protein